MHYGLAHPKSSKIVFGIKRTLKHVIVEYTRSRVLPYVGSPGQYPRCPLLCHIERTCNENGVASAVVTTREASSAVLLNKEA